ncbi:hypothetical protein G6F33_003757 [Rhizopus arrhizus]|nr:hypothetical protein G6F33_003757 [Rhizopus arrhizus]
MAQKFKFEPREKTGLEHEYSKVRKEELQERQKCTAKPSTTLVIPPKPSADMGPIDKSMKPQSVANVFNPKADDNCSFRALAQAKHQDENRWKDAKQDMLDELNKNRDKYLSLLFTPDSFSHAEKFSSV